MPLIIPANSITGGYEVDNSLRFNDDSSDYLYKSSYATATSTKKFTWSCWFKLGEVGARGRLFDFWKGGGSGFIYGNGLFFTEGHQLGIGSGDNNNGRIITTRKFRDPSAWYHVVAVYDSPNSTAGDRLQLYVNGVRETDFSANVTVTQNWDYQAFTSNHGGIGRYYDTSITSEFFDGYMAEVVFIDGQALDPTSFGEFDEDTGIWKPIDVSGLTFGNNGFYLPFENSGALGQDDSGNGNNFTVNNLTSIDQTTDTPTNNYCTLNPLDSNYASSTFSEGNCKIVTEASLYSYNTSTIGVSQGKWYCEVYIETSPHPTTKDSMIGIAGRMSESNSGFIGFYNDTYGIYGGNGNIFNNNVSASYGVSHTTGDIIGIYLDLDNNKLYFAKNGTLMNSGTGKDITDPSNTKAGVYFFVADDFGDTYQGTYRINFGNPIYTLTSGNSDPNGYGNFEYDPSAGTFDGVSKNFYALNTKNLAEYG